MNQLMFNAALEGLTPRRKQVLKLLLAGISDLDISQTLHIAESTVRKHIENICLAFGLRNDFPDERRSKRPELIALFVQYKPEWVVGQKKPPLHSPGETHRQAVEFTSLADRHVFILIDRSGSMVRKDADTGNQTRYDYLSEVVEGHVSSILSYGSEEGMRICDRLSVLFFSRKKTSPQEILIDDPSQVWKLFIENQPKTKTFISPTLHHCVDTWLEERKKAKKGAFFIIYTDGQFDDEEGFVDCIASACGEISQHQEVKFFVLGLGKDVNIKHFLELDFNVNQLMPFNVFVFDLVNEVDDIIELLARQLTASPHLAFPEWVRTQYPEFVEQVLYTEA